MDKGNCAELVIRCFHARTDAHIAHLMTRSYAAHKALNEFYDEIIDLADTYAEACQGRYGILPYENVSYRPMKPSYSTPQTIIETLRDWIDKYRKEFGNETELQNIIDEIVGQCDSTLYKLTCLK